MAAVGQPEAKGRVTLELTPEQKQQILNRLGLYWDRVTLDTGLAGEVDEDLFEIDPNLMAAQGRPKTQGGETWDPGVICRSRARRRRSR